MRVEIVEAKPEPGGTPFRIRVLRLEAVMYEATSASTKREHMHVLRQAIRAVSLEKQTATVQVSGPGAEVVKGILDQDYVRDWVRQKREDYATGRLERPKVRVRP